MQRLLVISGTEAQGSAVVRALSKTGNYAITVLTRSTTSETAISVSSLPHISLLAGEIYHEPTLPFQVLNLHLSIPTALQLGERPESTGVFISMSSQER